jgi:hypothetical protein
MTNISGFTSPQGYAQQFQLPSERASKIEPIMQAVAQSLNARGLMDPTAENIAFEYDLSGQPQVRLSLLNGEEQVIPSSQLLPEEKQVIQAILGPLPAPFISPQPKIPRPQQETRLPQKQPFHPQFSPQDPKPVFPCMPKPAFSDMQQQAFPQKPARTPFFPPMPAHHPPQPQSDAAIRMLAERVSSLERLIQAQIISQERIQERHIQLLERTYNRNAQQHESQTAALDRANQRMLDLALKQSSTPQKSSPEFVLLAETLHASLKDFHQMMDHQSRAQHELQLQIGESLRRPPQDNTKIYFESFERMSGQQVKAFTDTSGQLVQQNQKILELLQRPIEQQARFFADVQKQTAPTVVQTGQDNTIMRDMLQQQTHSQRIMADLLNQSLILAQENQKRSQETIQRALELHSRILEQMNSCFCSLAHRQVSVISKQTTQQALFAEKAPQAAPLPPQNQSLSNPEKKSVEENLPQAAFPPLQDNSLYQNRIGELEEEFAQKAEKIENFQALLKKAFSIHKKEQAASKSLIAKLQRSPSLAQSAPAAVSSQTYLQEQLALKEELVEHMRKKNVQLLTKIQEKQSELDRIWSVTNERIHSYSQTAKFYEDSSAQRLTELLEKSRK